jgi:hypothetical protein
VHIPHYWLGYIQGSAAYITLMIIIRQAQMQAFQLVQNARFDGELSEYLKAIAPERFENESYGDVLRFAANCRQKAVGYGVELRADVARFAATALFLGQDFDTDPGLPWARAILVGTAVSATEKIDRLTHALDAWIDAQADEAVKGGGTDEV